jgi:hypothetical protein
VYCFVEKYFSRGDFKKKINFVKNLEKMKTRIILSILLVTVFFIGCKNDKSVDSLDVVKPEVVDNSFKVALKVIVKKDDDFALYFTEDGSTNFFDVKPIWHGVKGSENGQEVVYTLPADVYPTQIRFDLGMKKDQEDITVKGVRMTYQGKTLEFYGPKFWLYFRDDKNQCNADISTGIVTAVIKDGERKVPSICPQQDVLGPELLKFGKQ